MIKELLDRILYPGSRLSKKEQAAQEIAALEYEAKLRASNRQSAGLSQNSRFILVTTLSGFGMRFIDPVGSWHVLPTDVSAEDLGAVILDALSKSRFLTAKESREYAGGPEAVQAAIRKREDDLMERFSYNKRSQLYRKMRSCSVSSTDNIVFSPMEPEEGGLMSRGREFECALPASSAAALVGKAARTALERCIPTK